MVVRPKDKLPPFTYWTDSLAQVSDLFPCEDSHKKNSIRLVERIATMQISKVVRGNEMPTEIWSTSVPAPPSTAPARQSKQVTFELRLVEHTELGEDTNQEEKRLGPLDASGCLVIQARPNGH